MFFVGYQINLAPDGNLSGFYKNSHAIPPGHPSPATWSSIFSMRRVSNINRYIPKAVVATLGAAARSQPASRDLRRGFSGPVVLVCALVKSLGDSEAEVELLLVLQSAALVEGLPALQLAETADATSHL